ncbi:hypothetical protein D3C84_606850 [compost metagenome]
MADLALERQLRVVHQRRNTDPAFGGEGLEQPRRRGRHLRPVRPVPDVGVGATDVVQAVVVMLVEIGQQLRAEFRKGLQQRPFGTVIGHEQDEGVVQLPLLAQVIDNPPDVPVHALDHRRINLHGPRGDLPLLVVQGVPLCSQLDQRMRLDIGLDQPQFLEFFQTL